MQTITHRCRSGFAVVLLLALALAALALPASAAEAPRAARSVHLFYPAPDATLYYNEVTVEQSQPGTYFCTCGFSRGYFGIQELADGKKVVLFSVWDPAGNEGEKQDPNAVDADRRVEVLAQGEGVRVRRFGGEGTGGQSFLDYPWEKGRTCKFLVRATPEGDKTTYAAWFFGQSEHQAEHHAEQPDAPNHPDHADHLDHPEQAAGWKHMATFRTTTKGEPLRGLYSFVEDFRRDGKSPNEPRSALYGNGWVKSTAGDWVSLTRARFTADSTPLSNIDASVAEKEGAFRLATGGDTKTVNPLNSLLQRDPPGLPLSSLPPSPPATQK